MIAVAIKTPTNAARKLFFGSKPNTDEISIPVQAPVPGIGKPTKIITPQ